MVSLNPGGPVPPRKPYAGDNNLCYKIRRI
nr:MAG TPA: hypothetical protein [Caudoviricetes sp.]DAO93583.1 MAG TPA: hypothetical protein [Caudoviricetes sp.]